VRSRAGAEPDVEASKVMEITGSNPASVHRDPWHQQPGESDKAYLAFVAYRDHDAPRSFDGAWREFVKARKGGVSPEARAPGHWRRWMDEHHWKRRAMAWDIRQQQARDQGRLQAIQDDAAARAREELLDERRREHEETEWELRTELITQARDMLQTKLYRQKSKEVSADGHTTVYEFVPAGWSKFTAVQMIELAHRLGRINLQMPTGVPKVKTDQNAAWESLLFESDGQFEAAMPPGTVQPMPADVLEKPPMPQPQTMENIQPRLPSRPPRP
jgi:hypothetical protein